MKNVIAIVMLSSVSLILVVGGFFALYATNPGVFGVQPNAVKQHAAVQKGKPEVVPAKPDSTLKVFSGNNSIAKETMVKKLPDSVAYAKKDTLKKRLPTLPKAQYAADTTDWKLKAKIFEAMSIDDASKILHKMKDKEVKEIIVYIKKRNAAKILATFEPERAARIIR